MTTENSSSKVGSKFAKHKETLNAKKETEKRGVTTFCGRLVIFIVFPLLIGCIALLTALAQKQRNPEYEINVDRDFFYPVTLGLALCIIVGFQTRGYATSKPEPLVAWPKVYKRKKIVHQYVGKGKAEAKED